MLFSNGKEYLNSLQDFLLQFVYPIANELDTDADALKEVFNKFKERGFFQIYIPPEYGGLQLCREDLVTCQEMIGRWAGALGFLQIQQATTTWALLQSENKELILNIFTDVLRGNRVIGNATSHLKANRKDAIVGKKVNGGYIINGFNPFVSGIGVFDSVAMGFNTDEGDEVFAFINLKHIEKNTAKFTPIFNMSCMRSLNTAGMHFNNFYIEDKDIIGKWEKFRFIVEYKKRPAYAFPLGIAFESMDLIKESVPKILIQEYSKLLNELMYLKNLLIQAENPDKTFGIMMKISWECLNFSMLVTGGRSLLLTNNLQRLQREINIWFIPRSSPEVIKAWFDLTTENLI